MIEWTVTSTETGDSDAREEYSIVLECPMVPRGPAMVGVSNSG